MAMSRLQLVELFEKLSIAQGEAYAYFETAKANRFYTRRRAVLWEMRSAKSMSGLHFTRSTAIAFHRCG
jgi:hypothetical protein